MTSGFKLVLCGYKVKTGIFGFMILCFAHVPKYPLECVCMYFLSTKCCLI